MKKNPFRTDNTIIVFTSEKMETIMANGGTGNWKVDPKKVRRFYKYVVCTRNKYHTNKFSGHQDHGEAFIIGKIKDVVPPKFDDHRTNPRWFIEFSEVALISYDKIWSGQRNPVQYMDGEIPEIKYDKIKWIKMEEVHEKHSYVDVDNPSEHFKITKNKDGKLIYNSDSGKEVEIDKDLNSKNNRSKETIKTTLEFYKNEISQHLGLDPDNIEINIRY
jgi:hypothetical protein